MKKILATLLALVLLMPQFVFANDAADLDAAAGQIDAAFLEERTQDGIISLPEDLGNGITARWHSESPALAVTGGSALLVPQKENALSALKVTLQKGAEMLDKTVEITVPARSVPVQDCAFGEDFASFTAFPDTWERVSANEGDIAVVEDPKDADNQCLLLDNSTSGAETKVTVKLPEPVKATAENPIVIAEYRFMNTVGLVNLMYLYGGANGSSIPVNMNIYNDYAYAQTSEGNETFLRPWVADTWYTVRVELDNSTKRFDLYLDGELKLENRPFRIAGADSISSFLIARTANRNGKVYYDDFKVYADPYYLLDSAVNSIVTENLESITGALSLPQTAGGYPVTWFSSDESIIAPDGTVNRPLGEDRDVLLTAIVEADGLRTARHFKAHVVGREVFDDPDEQLVNDDAALLNINEITAPQDPGAVTEDLVLPSTSANGADIVWSSSNMEAAAVTAGKAYIVRGKADVQVTLTASVEKNGYQAVRSFLITVKKMEDFSGPYLFSEDFETVTDFDLEDPRPKYELTTTNGSVQIADGAGTNGSRGVQFHSENADGNNAQLHLYTDDATGTVILEADVLNRNGTSCNVFYTYGDSSLFANMNMANRLVVRNGDADLIAVASMPINTWYKIRLVCELNKKVYAVYVDMDGDGVPELVQDGLKCRMEAAKINHLLFGGAKNVDLQLDNLKIYQDPFFPAEDAAQKLDLGRIDSLEGDLLLPKTQDNGVTISWISSDPQTIDSEGKVTRPSSNGEDKNVTLYVIFENNGYRIIKQYQATVLRSKTDREAVDADAAALLVPDADYLIHDLLLPKSGQNETTVSWQSSNEAVLSSDGKVTRPVYHDGKSVQLTLTATVTKNQETAQRQFTISVPEMNYALDGVASASTNGASSFLAIDGKEETGWSPSEGDRSPYLLLELKNTQQIDFLRANASIQPESVMVSDSGQNYTAVGTEFPARSVKFIKVTFPANSKPVLYEIGAYCRGGEANPAKADADKLALKNTDRVTADLELPAKGEGGSDIIWTSSNHSCLTDDGKVIRPVSGNAYALLTAKLKNGVYEAVKTFDITVLGLSDGGSSSGSGGGGGGGNRPVGPNLSGSVNSSAEPAATPAPEAPKFTDVSEGQWYYTYISRLAQDNLLSGVGDGTFEPDRAMNRAEFVKLLAECFGLEGGEGVSFSDVSPDAWYYSSLAAAYSRGIVKGVNDTSFGPSEKISRQDMAVMTARALALPLAEAGKLPNDFDTVSPYAQDAVKALFEKAILEGDENGNFRPHDLVTRAQAAKIMYCIKYGKGE